MDLQNLPIIINEKKLIRSLERPFLGLSKKSKIWIDVVLIGYVQETDDSFTLIGSLVDLETGKILASIDVFEKIDPIDALTVTWEDNLWEHIYNNCCVLAARFKEYFPLCEGRMIDLNHKELKTNICLSDGLKKGMQLIIYEKQNSDKKFIIIGEAKVKDVHEKYSLANLLEKFEFKNINDISMNYAVITR